MPNNKRAEEEQPREEQQAATSQSEQTQMSCRRFVPNPIRFPSLRDRHVVRFPFVSFCSVINTLDSGIIQSLLTHL